MQKTPAGKRNFKFSIRNFNNCIITHKKTTTQHSKINQNLKMLIYTYLVLNTWHYPWQITPPNPSEIFLPHHSDMSPQNHFPTESNADFIWTVGEYLLQKWFIPCKAQIVLGVVIFFPFKNKIKCPAEQNLEIISFRYLKTLVFDKFLEKLHHHLMFSFLKSITCDN